MDTISSTLARYWLRILAYTQFGDYTGLNDDYDGFFCSGSELFFTKQPLNKIAITLNVILLYLKYNSIYYEIIQV